MFCVLNIFFKNLHIFFLLAAIHTFVMRFLTEKTECGFIFDWALGGNTKRHWIAGTPNVQYLKNVKQKEVKWSEGTFFCYRFSIGLPFLQVYIAPNDVAQMGENVSFTKQSFLLATSFQAYSNRAWARFDFKFIYNSDLLYTNLYQLHNLTQHVLFGCFRFFY